MNNSTYRISIIIFININNDKANVLYVKQWQLQCNNTADIGKTISIAVSGYTALGVIGYRAYGNQNPGLYCYGLYIHDATQLTGIWSTAIPTSYGLYVDILYVKNS
jgi:hypothetical protein